jgi:hypothetical protein
MKITQYIRIERAISAAAKNDIRDRWLWGLRILNDPHAFAPGSSQLKPGRADEFVRATKAAGFPLTVREIQYRLQCARAYPYESQIAHASSQFEDWTELRSAGFPAFEPEEGERPADWRNEAERRTDLARALAAAGEMSDDQLALFPLDRYEPAVATLKEISDYAADMAELTARFAAKDQERGAYVATLIEAADGDLSTTWGVAHHRAFGEPVPA